MPDALVPRRVALAEANLAVRRSAHLRAVDQLEPLDRGAQQQREQAQPGGLGAQLEQLLLGLLRELDGRCHLVGAHRVELVFVELAVGRLLERQDDLPYPAGVVEFLDDDDAGAQLDEADEVTGASARKLYSELVEQATDRQIGEDELNAMSAYEMAATVEFTKEAKQELLELRSEPARLRLLALLLRAAIKRLELIDRAQMRAASNGKVRFG